MAGDPYLLGLDVGTQSLRAAVVDPRGRCKAFGVAPIRTSHPRPGWAEQDADEWWSCARTAVPQALNEAGIGPEQIVGISIDSTACTVVPAAADGRPLRKALLWMDQRSYRESDEISATGDPILKYVSGKTSPEWMLPKALWLKRHEPDVYARTERMVECTDWFMYRLTGDWTLSLNHVTVKWNYARPAGGWSHALLRSVGLEDLLGKWPERVVPLGAGGATLSSVAAAELGLRAGTPVAEGGIDAYLGMLGLGAVHAGDLAMIMGSSTCHLAQSRGGVFGSGLLGCYPDAVVEGLSTLEGGQTATGSIVDWYRKHFAGNEAAAAEQTGRPIYEILDAQAAAVPLGSGGLICLDYWQGNRCPIKDPRARGVFWGLSLSHGPGHVLRSIYEATAFGTRHILEDAAAKGLEIRRVFAGGGGAKSRLWLQIHADILGQAIHLTRETESSVLGAAMAAAVGAGLYADFDEAARAMIEIESAIEPDPSRHEEYRPYYEMYLRTYPALKELMHEMTDRGEV